MNRSNVKCGEGWKGEEGVRSSLSSCKLKMWGVSETCLRWNGFLKSRKNTFAS